MEPVTETEMLVRNFMVGTVGIVMIVLAGIGGCTVYNMTEAGREMRQTEMMIERGLVRLPAGTWVSTSCVGAKP